MSILIKKWNPSGFRFFDSIERIVGISKFTCLSFCRTLFSISPIQTLFRVTNKTDFWRTSGLSIVKLRWSWSKKRQKLFSRSSKSQGFSRSSKSQGSWVKAAVVMLVKYVGGKSILTKNFLYVGEVCWWKLRSENSDIYDSLAWFCKMFIEINKIRHNYD